VTAASVIPSRDNGMIDAAVEVGKRGDYGQNGLKRRSPLHARRHVFAHRSREFPE
jgi:hypothetical protein